MRDPGDMLAKAAAARFLDTRSAEVIRQLRAEFYSHISERAVGTQNQLRKMAYGGLDWISK